MRALPFLALVALHIAAASGQTARESAFLIRGTVRDSIRHRPLAGAVVELARVDSASREIITGGSRQFSAVTLSDSAGGFEFANLPAGLFALAFHHPVLEDLGVAPSASLLELGSTPDVRVTLSTPAAAAVRAAVCPAGVQGGLFTGRVVNAGTGVALAGAAALIEWSELTLSRRTAGSVRREARTVSDSSGRFHICGLPTQAPLSLKIGFNGFRSLETEMALPADSVFLQDFRLADSTASRGAGAIDIRVVDDSGSMVTSGIGLISSLDRSVRMDSAGARFRDLPVGTWVVELRSLGYERAVLLADAEPKPALITVRMIHLAHLLDPVSVVELTPRNQKILKDIGDRMRVASGTLIDSDNLSLRNATLPSEAIVAAKGFSYKSTTVFEARNGCRSIGRADSLPKVGSKQIAIYLDGARFRGGLQVLNDMVKPWDILAIEAYPDVLTAPFLWRTNDACAVVAFWTRR